MTLILLTHILSLSLSLTHTHTRARARHTHAHSHTRARTTRTHTQTRGTHARTHAHTHTHTHTYSLSLSLSLSHTHTRTHTHTHTHTHTYRGTCGRRETVPRGVNGHRTANKPLLPSSDVPTHVGIRQLSSLHWSFLPFGKNIVDRCYNSRKSRNDLRKFGVDRSTAGQPTVTE